MHITTERRCIACRNHFLKQDLIRISHKDDKTLVGDNQKRRGRGVYVCKNPSCIDLVIKKKLLNRAFSYNVSEEVYTNLRGYIE
ncbi:MAG: YlxR family protein [Clostridia bacterium]|nr:YlxR family protein [Clostridia bacterium]